MDQATKQCLLMAILAFNITFILFAILFNSGLSPFGFGFSMLRLLLGLLVAGGAAVGGYFGAKMTQ